MQRMNMNPAMRLRDSFCSVALFSYRRAENPGRVGGKLLREHRSVKWLALLILGTGFTSPIATAAEIGTLGQAVDYALTHNRMLVANAGLLDGAHARVDSATGRLLPRLDVSTGVNRTDSPLDYFGTKLNQRKITAADFVPAQLNNPGFITNYRSRIDLTMPVYQGGALWAGRERAGYEADASHHGHAYMRQQVIYATISAYVQVRRVQAHVEAAEAALGAAEKRYRDAQRMHERGMLIDSDVMDTHVHLLRTQVRLEQAGNNYARSLDELRLVMGLDGADLLHTDGEAGLQEPAFSLAKAMESALSARPDLQALEQRQQAARAALAEVRAAFRPQVNLFATQQWNAATPSLKNGNSMVGASVSMNIFSGGSDRAEVRAASAELASLEMQVADLRQQIGNEVAEARRRLEEARLRRDNEEQALKQSVESLRVKALRYRQGMATTADLLDAQARADDARIAGISAGHDVIVAEAGLWLAVGALDVEVIR